MAYLYLRDNSTSLRIYRGDRVVRKVNEHRAVIVLVQHRDVHRYVGNSATQTILTLGLQNGKYEFK